MPRITREEFLYRMAKIISYPTWVAAFGIGIFLVAASDFERKGWLIAVIALMGVAMPIGVKLSRMELARTMVAVFEIGVQTGVEAVEKKIDKERDALAERESK